MISTFLAEPRGPATFGEIEIARGCAFLQAPQGGLPRLPLSTSFPCVRQLNTSLQETCTAVLLKLINYKLAAFVDDDGWLS